MKNYVEIAKKIQIDNNYTFKKKDDTELFDVVTKEKKEKSEKSQKYEKLDKFIINNHFSDTSRYGEMSQLNLINTSDINFNKDFNLVSEMIPLTNPNNLSEIHPNNLNTNNESKFSHDKNSSFAKYAQMIPRRDTNNLMKDSFSRNRINESNLMNTPGQSERIKNFIVRSEKRGNDIDKYITKNVLDDRNNGVLLTGGSKLNKSVLSSGGVRATSSADKISGFDLNLYRERNVSGAKTSNSFNVPSSSDYRPLIKDMSNALNIGNKKGNLTNQTNSPNRLPTFSQNPNSFNVNNLKMFLSSNREVSNNSTGITNNNNINQILSSANNLLNLPIGNKYENNYNLSNIVNQSTINGNPNNLINQNTVKKSFKSTDVNKPPAIKKGMFSYTKPNSNKIKTNENSQIDLNTFLNNNNYNTNGYSPYGVYSGFSNFNNLNDISKHLTALQNGEFSRPLSSSHLDNSNASLLDKYHIKKDSSNVNLNKTENLVNLDETDKISVNSNKSTNSFNFNKYKVGLNNGFSTSKISVSDNTGVSDLSTLIKYENSNNNANYGKVIIGDNRKLQSTEQLESWGQKYAGARITEVESFPGALPLRKEESKNINRITQNYVSEFKNKPPHEKESRRMQLELLKMKMKERKVKGGDQDLNKLFQELKFNPIILDRPSDVENTVIDEVNLSTINSSPLIKKRTIQNDPRIQSILKRGQMTQPNKIDNNAEMNIDVPNIDSASIYLNTIKSNAHLNYSLEENSNDKIDMLCYLATPRILFLILPSVNKIQRIPFIFQLSPTTACHKYGFEHYIFQWNDINTLSQVIFI